MSDDVNPLREWRFYIQDMIGFAEKCQSYTSGMEQRAFLASGITFDATLRNLELIGEAASRVPDDIRSAYPECVFQTKPATDSRRSLPPIPRECCH